MAPAASATKMKMPGLKFPRLEVGGRLDREERPVRSQRAQRPVAVQAGGESCRAAHVMALGLDQPVPVDVEAEREREVVLHACGKSPAVDVGDQARIVGAGLEPGIDQIGGK